MSARKSREEKREAARREKGSVVRCPAAEVVEEMAILAREDWRRMTAPIPLAPRPPGRFWISRRPPLPPLPLPINPYYPPSPDRAEIARVAAVRARAHEESEAFLLAQADAEAAVPREPSPPRARDDHYDLAKWNRRRWL